MGNTESIKAQLSKGLQTINKSIINIDKVQDDYNSSDPSKITSDMQALNKLLERHKRILQVFIEFQTQNIASNGQNMQKKLISGKMMKYRQKKNQSFQEEKTQEKSNQESRYNIVINISEGYQLLTLLKNFEDEEHELQEKRKTLQGTPKQTPSFKEQMPSNQCILCYNSKIESVLPCAHAYCADCIHKFIVDKKQKKCPMCRTQFRESLNHNIYDLVDVWDDQFVNQLRKLFFDILRKRNSRQVKKVLRKSMIFTQKTMEENEQQSMSQKKQLKITDQQEKEEQRE